VLHRGLPRLQPKTLPNQAVTLGFLSLATAPESKTETKTNAREAFIKKVQTCMNTYNYADESKDVKGKVLNSTISDSQKD
jgi:hypothetical protein